MKSLTELLVAPRILIGAVAGASVVLAACSQAPVTVALHSLQASGNMSFVCQASDDVNASHGNYGVKLDECPDYDKLNRRLLGLVTQTTTNEVAVVDLRAGAVLDVDPSTPGYTFLRVGATPGAIVSTPGGVASFVGVTGLQKNGVFALPTTCLAPPKPGHPVRDLTTWSACALTSAPGDMQLLVAPAASSCQVPARDPSVLPPRECPADLASDEGPQGQRKLLIALPEEHKLVLLDAQELLDRNPGEFQPCKVETNYPLEEALPSGPVVPELPDDLKIASDVANANTCQTTQYPPASATDPTPAGMALSGNDLYVADRSLPVVHVIDVTDPCMPTPALQGPLLPHSYSAPERVVTTSRVAVSPLTPMRKQFVYAIDDADQPTASVMVFDVSPGATNRTPIVFPGAPRQPFAAPDRLRFNAPARDVAFVMRDFPAADPATGVGQFGVSCDPDPRIDVTSAAAQYRPNADYTAGARPLNLRGVFGFIMLTNGEIPIIDVEDFDAPCRRPIYVNHSAFDDFRGCPPDKLPVDYLALGVAAPTKTVQDPGPGSAPTSTLTATNESSCNIIEQNRPRANALSLSNSTVGLLAPTLRGLPQFSNPDPSSVLTPLEQPHMLAVDLPNSDPSEVAVIPAQVNISGQLNAACTYAQSLVPPTPPAPPAPPPLKVPPPCDALDELSSQPTALPNDPHTAVQNSLTLPLVEPRSYVQNESPTLTFEGRVIPDRTSGFLQQQGSDWVLSDSDASFCAGGVEDSEAILAEAGELGIPAADQPSWANAHADYVQITGDFLIDVDAYWTKGAGASCTSPSSNSMGRDACVEEFGGIDTPTALLPTRDLSIVKAFSDHLVVAARNGNTVDQVRCCFPTGTAYTVRAAHQWFLNSPTALHDIAAAPGGRCVHTAACDPRKKYFRSRAFEVCDTSVPPDPDLVKNDPDDVCALHRANVGCTRAFAGPDKDALGIPKTNGAIEPGTDGSQCIFENLTARFAVYRGSKPSLRDMSFSWSVTGGFAPLAMSLATQSSSISPQSMVYVPEIGDLAVVDGSTLGLSIFDLNSLGVVSPSPFF